MTEAQTTLLVMARARAASMRAKAATQAYPVNALLLALAEAEDAAVEAASMASLEAHHRR